MLIGAPAAWPRACQRLSASLPLPAVALTRLPTKAAEDLSLVFSHPTSLSVESLSPRAPWVPPVLGPPSAVIRPPSSVLPSHPQPFRLYTFIVPPPTVRRWVSGSNRRA